MKIAKRVMLSSIALLVVAATVVAAVNWNTGAAAGGISPVVGAVQPTPAQKADSIVSDGRTYSFRQIDAVTLEKKAPKETLPTVGNRETLLKLLKERGVFYDGRTATNGADDSFVEFAADTAMPAPMGNAADSGESGHSQTNEQVAGVSEGDVVKTDGKYLYALSGDTLRIIKADGAEMRTVSTIPLENVWGAEFYLIGDKLAVVGHWYEPWNTPWIGLEDSPYPMTNVIGWGRDCTVLIVYDISDRAQPEEARRVEMDGYSVSTRVIGDTVYLVTNKHVWTPFDQADSEIIMPCVRDTAEEEELVPLDFDRIYYIPDTTDGSYLLVGAVNINGDEPFEPRAYLGAGSQIYMSPGALYVTKWRYDGNGEKTDILRFAIEGTEIYYTGMGTVDGSPLNQYSMDEYKGFFRIATTKWGAGTFVTVLDNGMYVVGQSVPLEPDERMQSMRFMGDMGYIVTFQNTDPLFTIDLSDPFNPKVLGELKIPGFSQYLHPAGDGLLLGIGRDTRELYTKDEYGNESVVGFRDVGIKVSLFDVSDPYNPKELDKLSLGEGWPEVAQNPRALMCDPSRGLYGFTMERWNTKNNNFSALLLRVEGGRLSIAADLDAGEKFSTYGSRLCFIGDTLYLIHERGVRAYDYYTFANTGALSF
ncbi:MAG: beta-propeller domain-containing protein [Oscillospiraceae bacterium]|jgi:uncharacterized secreted protein with C-terminal beta-propeller domain|nr:beta-propeller domain-containing protein [Oscillospiraceae bacterium]